MATRPKDLEGSLSILGEQGSVVLGGHAVNHISTWRFTDERPEDADIQKSFSQDVPNVYGYGHMPYLASVVKSIRENLPAVDGHEGRKNIAILTALYTTNIQNLVFAQESAARGGDAVAPGCPMVYSKLGTSA